jgi:hypothetical protein
MMELFIKFINFFQKNSWKNVGVGSPFTVLPAFFSCEQIVFWSLSYFPVFEADS